MSSRDLIAAFFWLIAAVILWSKPEYWILAAVLVTFWSIKAAMEIFSYFRHDRELKKLGYEEDI